MVFEIKNCGQSKKKKITKPNTLCYMSRACIRNRRGTITDNRYNDAIEEGHLLLSHFLPGD